VLAERERGVAASFVVIRRIPPTMIRCETEVLR
jgi:hypothetical protein